MTISKTEDEADLEAGITKGTEQKNTEHGKKKKKGKKNADPDSVAPDSVIATTKNIANANNSSSNSNTKESNFNESDPSANANANANNSSQIKRRWLSAVICLGMILAIILFFTLVHNRRNPTEEEWKGTTEKELEDLRIFLKYLSGTIPTEIGWMTTLAELDLGNGQGLSKCCASDRGETIEAEWF